ncbi:hypothetical protein BT69DRAFT_1352058 [Atractiella rhizophila]|nr:hypothetical protein BT69DRAFT_1352058 [Atractiella rhizophila]
MERWEHSPFNDLPNEMIYLIFESMIKAEDYDAKTRENSAIFRHLKRLRLVNHLFSRISFFKICQLCGYYDVPRAVTMADNKTYKATPIDPIFLMEHYPTDFPPHLEILKSEWIKPRHRLSRLWSILLRAFQISLKLRNMNLMLGAPPETKHRKRILRSLAQLPSLKILTLQNSVTTGRTRWNAADLAFYLQQDIRVEWIQLSGWDLSSPADFSACRRAQNLIGLSLTGCRITLPILEQVLPFLVPLAGRARHRDDFNSVFFNTFAPGRLNPEHAVSLLSSLTTSLHWLIVTNWLHERDAFKRQIILQNPLDQHLYTFRELRRLILDGAHSSTNLVSPHFLQHLQCPTLQLLTVACCYLVYEDVLNFLSSRTQFAAHRTTKFWFSFTPLWGDLDVVMFAKDMIELDGDEGSDVKDACSIKPWLIGDEGDMIYEGQNFRVTFNEGGISSGSNISGVWD